MVLKADINACKIEGWNTNTGEVNARTLTVEMCEKMCSCAMAFVTFKLKDGTLYESLVKDGKAEIPEIKEPQFVEVGVYSSDIENGKCEKRYSPHPTNVYINNGSYSGNGKEPPIPTAGDLERLLGELNGKLDISKVVGYDPEMEFTDDTVFSTEAIFTILEYLNFILNGLAEEKENRSNKVTEINENSTDEQYASAKAVYDFGVQVVNSINGNLDVISDLVGGAE